MSHDCIVINQGNTSTKWGVFKNNELQEVHRTFEQEGEHALLDQLCELDLPFFGISVASSQKQQTFFNAIPNLQRIDESEFPGHNYAIGRPGEDRLANISGANFLFKTKAYLIVDFGTCITYTLAVNHQLMDGAISPGMHSRFRAMHEFTGNLPLIENTSEPTEPANSTAHAMRTGVMIGIVSELKAFIEKYKTINPELKLVFTGTDALHFAAQLEYLIFVEQNLTLFGIYALAQRHSLSL